MAGSGPGAAVCGVYIAIERTSAAGSGAPRKSESLITSACRAPAANAQPRTSRQLASEAVGSPASALRGSTQPACSRVRRRLLLPVGSDLCRVGFAKRHRLWTQHKCRGIGKRLASALAGLQDGTWCGGGVRTRRARRLHSGRRARCAARRAPGTAANWLTAPLLAAAAARPGRMARTAARAQPPVSLLLLGLHDGSVVRLAHMRA